jgi:thioredoxin reductase (NADPH)
MDDEVMDMDMMDEEMEVPVRTSPYEYDYFVIGGGSGGLSSAKEASVLGAKVALADFVQPSPKGTTWGLGGTCVNVGCIPKKLMHYSSSFGEQYLDQIECGWELPPEKKHSWERMVSNVQKHIQTLNWGYRIQLLDKNIQYYNNYASFIDNHTVALHDKTGKQVKTVTSEHFLIAVGGRPMYGGIPGAEEFCFTSDDIFSMKKVPDNILVVGASYISLECAGFLHGIGRKVTIMVRSILLRGFDQEVAERIGEFMKFTGVEFIRDAYPLKFERGEDDKVKVYYNHEGTEKVEEYGGVLLAIGRYAITKGLNLQNAGVITNPHNFKVVVNREDRSNVENIWAVGDVSDGKPELTPVAIQAGNLLAKRLFGKSTILMDYQNVATTVFTPLEYGCCGLSEEKAKELLGDENVEIYHTAFKPLEWNFLSTREDLSCFGKIIVHIPDNERVVGIHFLGPHAGEVLQGFAVAMKAGLTKNILDMTVGIHPTCAEEITKVDVTKRSGQSAVKTGC